MSYKSFKTSYVGNVRRGRRLQRIGKRYSPGLKAGRQCPGVRKFEPVTSTLCALPKLCNDFYKYENYVPALCIHATINPETHLTLNAQINLLPAITLVDSGATGVFLHPKFAQECKADIRIKSTPRVVRVIDGRIIDSGLITHEATVELMVGNHCETLVADITNTGRYHCILGTPWLVRHDPTIWWSQKKVLFESAHCQQSCVFQPLENYTPKPITARPPINIQDIKESSHKLHVTNGSKQSKVVPVSPRVFQRLTKKAAVYSLEISELSTIDTSPIPCEYEDLHEAFSEEASNELISHGPADMKIEFKDGQEPRNIGLRPMSPMELEEVRRYLEENLDKGWIRRSKSPVLAPIVFVRKKDGSI